MAKILIKLPRTTRIEEIKKEIRLEKFEKHYIEDENKDYTNSKNKIPKEEIKKEPHAFKIGKNQYITLKADFLDKYKQIRRKAQIISLKDLGRISTLLGLNKNSILVEAGSGSGAASCYYSKYIKEIHSYEINEEHLAIAKENAKKQECKNIKFYKKNIYDEKEVNEHEADAFLLDVPEPEKALKSVVKALRTGGRCVVYTPNLTQAQEVIKNLPEELLNEGTIEIMERQWTIKEKILRPVMQGLGHTAFLTTLRKIPVDKEKKNKKIKRKK